MGRVIDAQGGEANLKRHKSLRLRAGAAVETQGLNIRMVVYSRAPNAEASDLQLFAGRKRIGTIRGFFDGKEGGSESSIAPSARLSGDSLLATAIAATLFPELNWRTLFKSVTITGKEKVGEEEAYVVNLKPEKGGAVTDYISVTSFRVLRRKVQPAGQPETYSDFRTVDGVVLPFVRTGIMPGFGETVTTVTEAKFEVKIPDSIFQATPPAVSAVTN